MFECDCSGFAVVHGELSRDRSKNVWVPDISVDLRTAVGPHLHLLVLSGSNGSACCPVGGMHLHQAVSHCQGTVVIW